MNHFTVYVCETCGYKSISFDCMEEHEANHLGLSVKELHDYNALKSFARYMSSVAYSTNNKETREKHDKAIMDLIEFERIHNISTV